MAEKVSRKLFGAQLTLGAVLPSHKGRKGRHFRAFRPPHSVPHALSPKVSHNQLWWCERQKLDFERAADYLFVGKRSFTEVKCRERKPLHN